MASYHGENNIDLVNHQTDVALCPVSSCGLNIRPTCLLTYRKFHRTKRPFGGERGKSNRKMISVAVGDKRGLKRRLHWTDDGRKT